MKQLSIFIIVISIAAVTAFAFFTYTAPAGKGGNYHAQISGGGEVSVRMETGTATENAERIATDYRHDGWETLPVSTDTFKLFAKGKRTAAVLVEDTPDGVRVTEFRRK